MCLYPPLDCCGPAWIVREYLWFLKVSFVEHFASYRLFKATKKNAYFVSRYPCLKKITKAIEPQTLPHRIFFLGPYAGGSSSGKIAVAEAAVAESW